MELSELEAGLTPRSLWRPPGGPFLPAADLHGLARLPWPARALFVLLKYKWAALTSRYRGPWADLTAELNTPAGRAVKSGVERPGATHEVAVL